MVDQVLGKGSNGVVYKSLNMDTGDVVAIKQVGDNAAHSKERASASTPLPLPAPSIWNRYAQHEGRAAGWAWSGARYHR